jgi:hypothetical protein
MVKKLVWSSAFLLFLGLGISIAPDVKRYIRISRM